MEQQKIAPVLSDVRHQFEEWLISEHGLDAEWQPERNCYKEFGIHLAWQTWQAVLARVGAVREWQPISTAPTDCSPFLIFTGRVGCCVVVHDPDDPMPVTDDNPLGLHLFVDDGKFGPYPLRGDYPTHWMELPPAPGAIRALNGTPAAAAAQPYAQSDLRKLVDRVWNEVTESTEVPDTPWADRLIADVFGELPQLSGNPGQVADAQPGYMLVPVEPTPSMINAGLYQSSADMTSADLHSAWKDMLAAAANDSAQPSAQAQPSGNAGEVQPRPMIVTRTSDHTVMLAFSSCREASVYERAAIAASKGANP